MPTITFDQLKGAGTLNPDEFLANKEYNIVFGAPTCSGSAYFTMEAIRDADGFFDGSSAQPARAKFLNFANISQDTLIKSKSPGAFGNHVWSIVIPPEGGTFDFTPNISPIFADTVLLRGTGGITFSYTRSAFIFTSKAQLVTAVNLWISDNAAAVSTYGQINTWDVSGIINMSNLFDSKTTFNSDISNWDVSLVENMASMFSSATSFNQDISSWNVGNVTDMSAMFSNANTFDSPLNNWDVSNVTNMAFMFEFASAFQQPLNLWEVNSLTNGTKFMGTTGDASAITYTEYSTLLIGWAANASIATGITISFGDSQFTPAGLTAKNILTGTRGWTITDGGAA
jgi:surface protein